MRKEGQALITLETGDIMKRRNSIRVALVLMVGVVGAVGAATPQESSDFVRITPAEIHWQNVPDGHGVQQAILFGDPAKPGMYVVRVKFPPHIMDRPHWHPMSRYVTVLEGTWYSGTGDTFDVTHAIALKPGSFMVHPAKAVHWDGSGSAETVIVQIIGEGPGTTTALDTTKPFWLEVPH
jgi:quercetin dioxygenase-like cupin family protein